MPHPVRRPARARAATTTAGALLGALALAAGSGLLAVPPADAGTVGHTVHQGVERLDGGQEGRPGQRLLGAADRATDDTTPLVVSIDRLTPSSLTEGEPATVTVSGEVTNVDDVPWTTVNLYPVVGDDGPITTESDLASAADSAADLDVGDRITDVSDSIDRLDPGESATYSITVPPRFLPTSGPGVYWFAVHASGASREVPRDEFADGRARTFLPLVPRSTGTSDATDPTAPEVPVALVLPLRHYLGYRGDGRLAHPAGWERSMDSGRLADVLRIARAAGPRPLTWLLDPAVPDAVHQLARGNEARSIAPTAPADDTEPGDGGSPSDGASDGAGSDGSGASDAPDGSGDEAVEGDADSGSFAGDPVGRVAQRWLDRLQGELTGRDVMTLPYGDVDVTSLADHDPDLLATARARTGRMLQTWGVDGTPVVAPPSGHLDAATLGTLADGDPTTVLLDDDAFVPSTGDRTSDPDATPTVRAVGDATVVAASSGAAAGGPAPGDAVDPVALRQRVLSEAALRLIDGGSSPEPLVVDLPPRLGALRVGRFFRGLDPSWLRLTDVDEVTTVSGQDVDPATLGEVLDEQPAEARTVVDLATVAAAGSLITAGSTLQGLLTRNDAVSGAVTDEALAGVSYGARTRPDQNRDSLDAARRWLERRLDAVVIHAPPGVTLSSSSGDFASTITNRLDEPVTVSVSAVTDGGVEIAPPQPVELGPKSRTTLILQARASEIATHRVTLRLTDAEGHPLGSTATLSVRSAQVSNVIWLILGTGVGLLALAIVIRLVRRFRGRGRGAKGDQPPPDDGAGNDTDDASPDRPLERATAGEAGG